MEKYHNSEFFRWQEEYGEYREKEGKIIGKLEGKLEERIEIIKQLLKSMNPKEIAEKTEIPLSEIEKIAEN